MEKRNRGLCSSRRFDIVFLKSDFHRRYIIQKNGCWKWWNARGWYGSFPIFGRIEKAHRAAYILFKGEIGVNQVVRHSCDNQECVNPEHLLLGTQKDNIQDQISRGRNTRGSKSHFAKLTPREVVSIRALYATGKLKQKEIAEAYGVRQQTICKIVNIKKWKDVI